MIRHITIEFLSNGVLVVIKTLDNPDDKVYFETLGKACAYCIEENLKIKNKIIAQGGETKNGL